MAFALISRLRLTKSNTTLVTAVRGHRKLYDPPPDFSKIVLPPLEERELVELPATPHMHGLEPCKFPRALFDMRGPELINNQLIHRQFGIIALTGAQLAPNHIEVIRTTVNRYMKTDRMFAVWRIEPPWKPVVKKGLGKKMGGGKAPIHHYVTPIRAGHIIIEMGGHMEFFEIEYYLRSVCKKMPCDALAVSQQLLDDWEKEEKEWDAKNINPFSISRVIEGNMQGCHKWLSPYDIRWKGMYE